MDLLPVPLHINLQEGHFSINYDTTIAVPTNMGLFTGQSLLQYIRQHLGLTLVLTTVPSANHIVFTYSENLQPQAYELEITPECIQILASSDSGLFYGLQTLKQLIKQYKRHLPALQIVDQPLFQNRGFYHDITRGKVPTLESLKELAELAAHYKLNQLQLYIEHTYLFSGHSEVWTVTDPLTAEEILELDDYCHQRFIELVPSLATFGHLYEALRSETFTSLCEFEDVQDLPYSWVQRMRHYTLDISNEGSIKFVEGMIDQFLPLFRSKKFNICADETFDLGRGKNKRLRDTVGPSKMYVSFLNKIIACVKKHECEAMFWGDIIIKHPECIQELPRDLICLNWWYGRYYDLEKVKMIRDQGFRQYVCPGVQGWNRLMNNFILAYDNIEMMVDHGKRCQAVGVLNTDWGDYGHWNFFANSLPGLIYGAQYSWSINRLSFEEINAAIDLLQYGSNDKSVMNLLVKAAELHHLTLFPLVQWLHDSNPLYMLQVSSDTQKILLDTVLLKTISSRLLDIMSEVPADQRDYLEAYYIAVEGIFIFNNLIPHVKLMALNQRLPTAGFMSAGECAVALEQWLYQFKRVWLKRNKPSELYRIVQFVQQLSKELRRI